MNNIFRILVVLSTFLYVFWVFIPYLPFNLSQEELDALSWISYGAILNFPDWFWVVSTLVWVLVAIGMFFFIPIARMLYLILIVSFLFLTPFLGIGVYTALELFLLETINILDGAILTIAFLTSVSNEFKSRSNKTLQPTAESGG